METNARKQRSTRQTSQNILGIEMKGKLILKEKSENFQIWVVGGLFIYPEAVCELLEHMNSQGYKLIANDDLNYFVFEKVK